VVFVERFLALLAGNGNLRKEITPYSQLQRGNNAVGRISKLSINPKLSIMRLSAKFLESLGAHSHALSIVDRAIKSDINSANLHLQASRLYLKEGQVDRAVLHWKKAAGAENIGSFLYWFNKIYRPSPKSRVAKKPVFEDPDPRQLKNNDNYLHNSQGHEAALNDIGVSLLEAGKPADALLIFNTALKNGIQNTSICFNAGLALSKLSRHEEAVDYYTKAQSLGLNSLELLNNKGYSLFHCQRYDEALACYELARGMAPTDITVLSNLASCYQRCGDNKKAIACFESALKVHSGDDTLENNLGICLENDGDFKSALKHYNNSLLLNPNNTFAKINKAGCLARMERFEEALRIYEDILNNDPDNHHVWGLKADLLLEVGRHREATESYRRALGLTG